MQEFKREGCRPAASAQFLWDDEESGDCLRVSIQVRDEDGHADFFADLEATGFRRVSAGNAQDVDSKQDAAVIAQSEIAATSAQSNNSAVDSMPADDAMSAQSEMAQPNTRRNGQAVARDGEDGGMLPCSIDVSSAFHASDEERELQHRKTNDEDPGEARRASA